MTTGFPHCICPTCADLSRENSFTLDKGVLRCPVGHTFDVAREGYVNLLPASGRKDAVHGDTPAMLRSRRHFLDRGHYQFLADAVTRACVEVLSSEPTQSSECALLDVGCGEGYYLDQIIRQQPALFPGPSDAGSGQPGPQLYGMDLARDAARMAAKRSPQLRIAVGNTMVRLPFATGSMTMVLNLFAPRSPREFARVLDPNGTLLVVIPASEHLQEIRQLVPLLPIEADKQAQVIDQLGSYFEMTGWQPVNAVLDFQPSDVRLLIGMTPNAWFVPDDRLSSIDDVDVLATQAKFILMQFRKNQR